MHVCIGSARVLRSRFLFALVALFTVAPAVCQQAPIQLPKPQMTGGMPLMQALAQRQTTRACGIRRIYFSICSGISRVTTTDSCAFRSTLSRAQNARVMPEVILHER